MRVPVMVLAALLGAGVVATGQTTPPAKAPPTAAPTKLDQYLTNWEQAMKKIQTLAATELSRVNKDKVFGMTRKYTGYAQYMRSGSGPTALNMAVLEMREAGKADFVEKFVCTGTFIYQFYPAQKEIRAYELPRPKAGQVGDDSFLGFLFGMRAEEAKRRYEVSLAKTPTAPNGEDAHYIYIDIKPRFATDKADFARARLVLNKDSFLPRQLWFEQANGNETWWDVPRLQSGVVIDRRIFDAPRPAAGWKLVPINRDAPTGTPRVIRSNR